jgi:protein SCO1/2
VARNNARGAMARRSGLRWAALALAVVLVAVAIIYVYESQISARQLVGGAIADPPRAAPGFTLTDQFGHSRSLNDLAGKPVALTFVYTTCPDVCPLISGNFHLAYQQLGNSAPQVGLVAVTVDPEHDDVNQIRSYSDKLGLTDEWFFLTGSRPQLEAVWATYGIDAQKVRDQMSGSAQANSPEEIEHSAPVFLIDKRGQVRAMLPVDVSADVIASDLSVLLAER